MDDIDDDDLEDRFTGVCEAHEKALKARYPTGAAYVADLDKTKRLITDLLPENEKSDTAAIEDWAKDVIGWAAVDGISIEQAVRESHETAVRLSIVMAGGSGATN